MIPLLSLVAALSPAAPPQSHESANPLYRTLLETGVTVSAKDRARLPAPSMPDGLDAEAQQKVLREIAGEDYSVEDLTRNSVVAPFVLRIRDVKPSDPEAPARGVDMWFVVYGSLDMDLGGAFFERSLGENRKGDRARELKPEELAKRGIRISPGHEKNESYGHVVFNVLDRVQLEVTGHAYWTKSAESLLAAAEVDPRFRDDPEFPNRWRKIEKEGDDVKGGPWQPYSGAGQYLKVTKLASPEGALFAEYHVVFVEPAGWFDGANLLRSKLPPAAQTIVRNMRRELLRQKK